MYSSEREAPFFYVDLPYAWCTIKKYILRKAMESSLYQRPSCAVRGVVYTFCSLLANILLNLQYACVCKAEKVSSQCRRKPLYLLDMSVT